MHKIPRIPVFIISLFFFLGSMGHFFAPEFFILAMPDYLNYHRELVQVSGVFELLGAIGILIPKTRLLAGYGLILLCVVVFPVNINMALHPENFTNLSGITLYIRLPLQIVFIWFIWWAIKIERHAKKGK